MGAASWPKAIRAVEKVLRVDRCQQHRHRALDYLILERRLPNRTLPPVVLLNPDTLDGRCLLAATALPRVPVAPVLVKVFGLLLRRSPINPCGTRLVRLSVRFPQKVCINQVGQGREHPVRIVGGLRRKALALWCDGWCAQGLSRLSLQRHVMPGIAFPPGGPAFPTCPGTLLREACPLPVSGHFACRSRPDTLPVSVRAWCPSGVRGLVDTPRLRQGLWSPGPPLREYDQETSGSPTCPRAPCAAMPRSSPPVVS